MDYDFSKPENITPEAIAALNADLAEKSPRAILKFALSHFENIAISFSGAEDVALIEMSHKLRDALPVFSLDTGRLHPETYRKGLFSFYEDGHKECCSIRKVQPLRRKLATLDAWISGQRKDQSPSTRSEVAVIEIDAANGKDGATLIKFNPLANWSSKEVWDYLRTSESPTNALHEKGFISIGCEPCTRPVLPNQHEREGRWWWEEETQKECGLHIK